MPSKPTPPPSKTTSAPTSNNTDCYIFNDNRYMALAEANLYPSPEKVLNNAKKLALSVKQIERSQHIFDVMDISATKLESKLKSKQQLLDRLFINGTINDDQLANVLTKIGVLETKLRYVHLRAHLQQKAVLTASQLQQYKQLSADH